jgi:transcriptional regulator with PAS, ATPase and Fis domain
LQAHTLHCATGVEMGNGGNQRFGIRVARALKSGGGHQCGSAEKIASGQFCADLFYRLARFQVELPPLRQGRDDILLLAQHFLALFSGEMGVRVPDLSAEAQQVLQNYDFLGNERERIDKKKLVL